MQNRPAPNPRKAGVIVVIVVSAIFFLFITGSSFVTLEPGEKGIMFRKFTSGLDKENLYDAGFHVIAPWNNMIVYDVKEQSIDFGESSSYPALDVLDKSGLSILVDVSVRFYPVYDKIGTLHESFGTGYVQKLIIPEVRSAVRKVMGNYTAEEIYSTKRTEVEQNIIKETQEVLKNNNIEMTALLMRSIILPEKIRQAIETKLQQEQEALAYKFKLDKETSEAERKKIAAQGEALANQIINSSLTPGLLKMRGIEATIKLAESPNAKVIVIGSGKDGLPLILNAE